MRNQILYYQKGGVYFCHSAISQLNLSLSETRNCAKTFTNQVATQDKRFFNFVINGKKPSLLNDIYPLLIVEHERNHFTQLMSTPYGLLLWRTINTITTGLQYLSRVLSYCTSKNNITLPLDKWYQMNGRNEIANSIFFPPNDILLKLGLDISNYNKFIPKYIDKVFIDLEILSKFLRALEGNASLNMKEFVLLANKAFDILKLRSDLDIEVEWVAHDLSAPSYLPITGFAMNEILEAGARFRELEIITGLNTDIKLIKEWENRSIFGLYKPAYEWLKSEIYDPTLARIAIDISIMTPIDLCGANAVSGKYFVEDILPSWRLLKVVGTIQNMFWSNDYQEQEKWAGDDIALKANIPSPREVAKACLSMPFSGPSAWDGDAKWHNIPEILRASPYFDYIEAQTKRAFEIRVSDSLAFVAPNRYKLHNFQPIIEFFEDEAFFYENPGSNHDFLLYLKTYEVTALNLATLALLDDGDVSDLLLLQLSFTSRMVHEDNSNKKHVNLWDVKKLLENQFDPMIYRLFQW